MGRKKRQKCKNNNKSKYANQVFQQKDLIKCILSFLNKNWSSSGMNRYFYASKYVHDKELAGFLPDSTVPIAFTSLPIQLSTINKSFNNAILEVTDTIVCAHKHPINILKLTTYTHLTQLHWIYNLNELSDEQTAEKINDLTKFKFPNLEILQIHYDNCWMHENGVDITLHSEHLPKLESLILGTITPGMCAEMRINDLNLDLDITKLRIHDCSIKNLDSLRFSLARCSLVYYLDLILKPFNKKQERGLGLYSLSLPSVECMFVQSLYLPEISIYAPKLELIQFYFCDKLDRLILLDRVPYKLRSYTVDVIKPSINSDDEEDIGIDLDEDQEAKEPLTIGFDNCYDDLVQRHVPNFKVIRGGEKVNGRCNITFTYQCAAMLVWPYAQYL